MANKTKILFVANTAWYLFNFRLALAKELKARGLELVFVAPRDRYAALLEQEGFRFVEWELFRRSINPYEELLAFLRLGKIYAQEKPTAVHHFTVKCVLYGSIQARLHGVRAIFNSITGLGHIFITEQPMKKLIRFFLSVFYRILVAGKNTRFIFQNPDDLALFQRLKILRSATLIRSSGVNMNRFQVPPAVNSAIPVLLFASRLLVEKGVVELVEAARILHQRNISFLLKIAGHADDGNPSSIPSQDIQAWSKEKYIEFLGHVDQVENLIREATIVVLPSYREGVPKILLEAAAMERALVATDVPGCREIVQNNITGLLVPVKNAQALADALEKLLRDEALRKNLGKNARNLVLKEFDEKIVIQKTCDLYQTLFSFNQA